MNRQEYYLIKIIQEASEVIKDATKVLEFGPDIIVPGTNVTNRDRLITELNDLAGAIHALKDSGFNMTGLGDPHAIAAKVDKINHYMKVSQQLGTVV